MTKLRNGIAIVGASLVPQKLVDFITRLTGEGYKGDLKAVVFEEEDTSDKFGHYFAEGRVAVVYLQTHLNSLLEKVKDPERAESVMALHASLWLGLVNTVVHEALHNESHKVCRDEGEPFDDNEEEIEKESWAKVVDMAKEYNLEPPTLGEYGFLEKLGIAADLLKTLTDSDEEWTKHQRSMMELKLIVSHDDENVHLETLREYINKSVEKPEDWDGIEVKPLVDETTGPDEEIIGDHGFRDPVSADNTLGWDQTGMEDVDDVVGDYMVGGDEPDFFEENHTPFTKQANPATFGGGGFNASQHGFQQRNNGFQQQNNGNAGGNWGVQQQTLPILNIGPQEAYQAMNELLYRMCARFFNDCQFRAGQDNPFAMPQAVYEPLFIGDIPHIKDILVSADLEDGQGEHHDVDIWNRPQANLNGCISGLVFKKASSPLPAFRFYINSNGVKSKRLFIAQNIHKQTQAGGLSENAMAARQGNCIAWLMNIDPGMQNGFIAKMVNGNLEMANQQRSRSMGQ